MCDLSISSATKLYIDEQSKKDSSSILKQLVRNAMQVGARGDLTYGRNKLALSVCIRACVQCRRYSIWLMRMTS